MEIRADLKSTIINTGTALYFIALIVVNQFGGIAASAVWSLALILAAVAGLYAVGFKITIARIEFLFLIFITGVLNEVIIGTTTYRNQILLILYVLVSYMLMSEYVSERLILAIILLNAAVVVYKFITVGFTGNIYTNSSSNFVSVQLLYPTVVYYSICESRGKKISIIPAAIVWFLSLLSRGRGGIISTSILLIGIIVVLYRRSKMKVRTLSLIIGIIIIGAIFLNLDAIVLRLNSSIISEHFRARGLESSRTRIWSDYVNSIVDYRSFMFGGDLSQTVAGQYFNGNIHNSFLNIHIQNGIIMLFAVIIIVLRRFYFGIKDKKWVYFVCFLSILVRAFTDNVFWPAYGTPILFFMLFYENTESKTRIKAPILLKK